jgi:hypothetical protein
VYARCASVLLANKATDNCLFCSMSIVFCSLMVLTVSIRYLVNTSLRVSSLKNSCTQAIAKIADKPSCVKAVVVV